MNYDKFDITRDAKNAIVDILILDQEWKYYNHTFLDIKSMDPGYLLFLKNNVNLDEEILEFIEELLLEVTF